jgi:superfamily II DNA helicase RecQ
MIPARNVKSGTTPDALSVLNSVFGLPAFRGEQEKIVRHVTEGGNCLVLMPTGGGKSLCYQLPSLLRDGCGIVVSPLIALMRDQVAGLLEAGKHGRTAAVGWRSRPALHRPRTAVDGALPVPARPRPDRIVCDR